jgi:hypothetical protein
MTNFTPKKDYINALKKVEEAKKNWVQLSGQTTLLQLRSNPQTPKLLKHLFDKNCVTNIRAEQLVTSSDYMPDYGTYIVLDGNEEIGFLLEILGEWDNDNNYKREFHCSENFTEELVECTEYTEEGEFTMGDGIEVFEFLMELLSSRAIPLSTPTGMEG